MIRNLLSGVASGLLVFAFLLIWGATNFAPPVTAYFLAGLVAAIGGWIWPVVIGWFLVRRRRNKQRRADPEGSRQAAGRKGPVTVRGTATRATQRRGWPADPDG